MTQILLENIKKSYGNVEVIHEVNCAINEGEFIVIVGPSGCGKSTLLRMIAGLEEISEGTVSIGGRVVNKLEPAERDIAMVFQNYALYPHMTVYNNMAYGLKIRGTDKQEIEKRVNDVAEILELKEYLQRSPRQLSGGQRQRVAMGRAIVRKPSVFLFDEPLSNLDAKLRVQMRLEIKKLQESLGITSVYVTHDQIEAMTLGHRLMVLNDGYVEQFGTPIELYEKPLSQFVAGFIGSPSMNFIEAKISEEGKQAILSNDETLNLPADYSSFSQQKVNIGIRPEHFHIAESKSETVSINVSVVEHLGADTLVHGTFGLSDSDMTVRLRGVRNINPGEQLSLSFDLSSVHVFSADTGKRLETENSTT